MKTVTGTIIQGRYSVLHNVYQWVTSYKLQYSVDGLSWITYASSDDSEEVFPGNTDRNTPVTNLLDSPTDARYVRFLPQSYHGWMSMRVEVLGCVNGVQCPARAAPANGAVTPTGAVSYPNGVTFTCNSGYVRNGAATPTCQADGTWSDPVPTCNRVQCPGRAAPANGALTSTGMVFYPNGVVFSCNSGFTLNGQATLTCQADGTWSHPVPTCSPRQCPALTAPPFGVLRPIGARSYQDTVTFECDQGYTLNGATSATCQADETWSNPVPTCTPVQCPARAAPAYGAVTPTGAVSYPNGVTFTCNSGYTLNGQATPTCQADGTWSHPAPTCQGKACQELPILNNGNRTEGHLYGDTVIFSCNEGYEPIGSENRTCQSDQSWSGVQPNCSRKACPELPLPNNGNRTEGYLYGDTVTFSCDDGYEVIGSENRTCQADQSWSGEKPAQSCHC
ncbi:P-selectin-like [Branchiostoma floridae x Branchiostoma belcheri]